MNLKALLTEAKSIVDALNAGTATDEQKSRMPGLTQEIKDAKAAEAEAKSLSDLVAGSGGEKQGSDDDRPARSLGAHFAAEMKSAGRGADFVARKSGQFTATEFKAAGDPSAFDPNEGGLPTVQQEVTGIPRTQLTIASLLSAGTLDGDSLVYFKEVAGEGGAGTVAPGTKKPYVNFKYEQVREGLSKIAALSKVLDEMMEDYGFLVTEINGALLYDLSQKEEEQLLYGDGTSPNLLGITERSGVLQVSATDADLADKAFSAQMQVLQASQRMADGIVVNPADYEKLRLAKDGNQQYLGGGPFQGQYGVGGVQIFPPLWGLQTVVTPAITAGSVLVGAFKSATLFRKGGVRVDAANTNVDDFETNKVTLRAEERIALKVPRANAFAEITVGDLGE